MRKQKTNFSEAEIKAFEPTEKIGIIATKNDEGLPHLTLLTTLAALTEDKLAIGQFSQGLSKEYMQRSNDIGFLVLTLDKNFIRGSARWTHLSQEGEEYEMFNNKPMFRYNTYFGINTVHYLDLLKTDSLLPLPMAKIIMGALLSKFAKGSYRQKEKEKVLNPFSEKLFNQLASLCFLSYIDAQGVPQIIPVIQCQAAGSSRLVFSTMPYGDEIKSIEAGSDVAVLGLSMNMQNVLVRGKFTGIKRARGIKTASLDIEWVYNSLPPAHGQIYPAIKLEPVENF